MMSRSLPPACALACLTLWPSVAIAQEPIAPARTPHRTTITIAPLMLLKLTSDSADGSSVTVGPIVELLGERAITPNVSAAIMAGVGTAESTPPKGSSLDTGTAKIWEAGAQGRYYVLGDFEHGMNLGVEGRYLGVTQSATDGVQTVSASAGGFGFGPFIGYKVAMNVGFTFDATLGAMHVDVKAEGSSSTGKTATASDSKWLPTLRLNVGWSF